MKYSHSLSLSVSDYYPAGILCPGGHCEGSAKPRQYWVSDLCPGVYPDEVGRLEKPATSWVADSVGYRYGFNGKELDPVGMGGGGSTYDYGFRIYNAQIAKFLSVDPLTKSYPWYTPYQFAGNNPIAFIDLDGLEEASPKMTNVIILVNPDAEQILALENDASKNTNWHYINAKDLNDAAVQFKLYMGESKADNIVIRSHGNRTGPALVPDGDISSSLTSAGKVVSGIEIEDFSTIGSGGHTKESFTALYGGKHYDAVSAFFDIAGGLNSGGSMIFSGCNVGQGDFGVSAAKAFNRSLGLKVNIYTNQDLSSSWRWDDKNNPTMLDKPLTSTTNFKAGFIKSSLSGFESTNQSIQLNSSGTPFSSVSVPQEEDY